MDGVSGVDSSQGTSRTEGLSEGGSSTCGTSGIGRISEEGSSAGRTPDIDEHLEESSSTDGTSGFGRLSEGDLKILQMLFFAASTIAESSTAAQFVVLLSRISCGYLAQISLTMV